MAVVARCRLGPMSSMTQRVDQPVPPSRFSNRLVWGRTMAITWSPLRGDVTMCSASSRHASHCQLVGVTSTGLPAVSFSQPLDRMRRFTTGIPLPVVRYSGSAGNRPLMIEMLGSLAKSVSLRFFLVWSWSSWYVVDSSSTPTVKQYMPPSIGSPLPSCAPASNRARPASARIAAVTRMMCSHTAYSSNWAMNSSIALRVTRRQLLVPRRLGGRNVVRVPLFAAMSSA